MSPELHAAIENLYAAFSDEPKPSVIEGCPCCIERKGADVLLRKPLREITPDEMSNYAACVFNTVGSLPDFHYLLPRILEIPLIDGAWYPDSEIIAGKFKVADFDSWPEIRRRAVKRYYEAAFDDALALDDPDPNVDDWVCALAHFRADVEPFLAKMANRPGKVMQFYERNSQSLNKGRLANSFWDIDLPAYRQILAWFESPKIKNLIKRSYGV